MSKFVVVVARMATEETSVLVEAPNAKAAEKLALEQVRAKPHGHLWCPAEYKDEDQTRWLVAMSEPVHGDEDDPPLGPLATDRAIAHTWGVELVGRIRDIVNALLDSPLQFKDEFDANIFETHKIVCHPVEYIAEAERDNFD